MLILMVDTDLPRMLDTFLFLCQFHHILIGSFDLFRSNLVVPELDLLLHVVFCALDLRDAAIVLLAQALNLNFETGNSGTLNWL